MGGSFIDGIYGLDDQEKVLVLFLIAFTAAVVLSWSQGFFGDEGNHSILGLFYMDMAKWWVNNPTLSVSSIFQYGISYLVYYPILSVYYPPLLHFLAAGAFGLFGTSLAVGRFVVLVCSVLTLYVTFKLGEDLFDSKVALLGTVFLGLSFLYFQMSRVLRQEMPMLLFFLLSLYFYNRTRKEDKWLNYILGGLFFGLSFLSKWLALPLLFILFFFADLKRDNWIKVFVSLLISGIVVLPWSFVAYKTGALFIPTVTSVTNEWVAHVEPSSFSFAGILYYPIKLFSQLSPVIGGVGLLGIFYYCKEKGRHWKGILAWIISVFVFAWLIPNKGWRFTFNYLPAFTLAGAWFVRQISRNVDRKVFYSLLAVILISELMFLGASLQFPKTSEGEVVSYLEKREGPILFSYGGDGLRHTSFMFRFAKDEKRQVYRGCIFNDRPREYFEKIIKRENIKYAIVPEKHSTRTLNYILSGAERSSDSENSRPVKGLIVNSSLFTRETKVGSAIIYKNKKYNASKEDEVKCNYVCAIQKWVCENTTMRSFEPLS